jgi:RNA polymerase sigma factor (sigma-70 family)
MSISLREWVFASRSEDDTSWRSFPTPARTVPQEQRVATNISDATLLEQLRGGNDAVAADAFSVLFLRHTPVMFVASRRGACGGDIAQADDAVQAVMIRIWEKRKELPPIDDLQGYLVRAVGRECSDRRRSSMRTATRDAHGGAVGAVETKTPERVVIEEELLLALRQAIQKLPGRMGDLFRAWYSSGASYEAVAKTFDVAPQAVARARLRAIAYLREDPTLAPFWSSSKD